MLLLLLLRRHGLVAAAVVAARFRGWHIAGHVILRRRRIGGCRALRFLSGRTAFGHGVAAVFIVFVFGHGQTSLGAVEVKLEGERKWV
jgi:hypothetical protein